MFNKYPYLQDKNFLTKLFTHNVITQRMRINILDQTDRRLRAIEGYATGGNVNINGKSSVRRTASLNLVADESMYSITEVDNLISLNKRTEIEIGIDNPGTSVVGTDYLQPVFWFPLGIYAITNAQISHNTQGINISLTLKDKMVLLNGEIGGVLSAPITFHPLYVESIEEGTLKKVLSPEPTLIRTIIMTLVHELGGIPVEKIIIEDIENEIKNQVSWFGSQPIYGDKKVTNGIQIMTLVSEQDTENEDRTKFNTHDAIGYKYTPFVFPGKELTASAGESITSVLDKIQKALGNYEYFFDLDGVFHFRAIKNFLYDGSASFDLAAALNDQSKNPLSNDSYFVEEQEKEVAFTFDENTTLISSYTNQPNYANIKNDISVWGQNKGTKTAIRYRLIIDTPPRMEENVSINYYIQFTTDENGVKRVIVASKNSADIKNYDANKEDEFKSIEVNKNTLWQQKAYLDAKLINNPIKTYYSQELEEEWPKIYDVVEGGFLTQEIEDADSNNKAALVYFIDMIDPNTIENKTIKDICIEKIGRREKVINDTSVDCLFLPTPPNFIYIDASTPTTAEERKECINNGENFCQVSPSIAKYINAEIVYNSAYNKLRSVLHEYIGYNESISISSIPLYFLDVNSRITVEDYESDIHGDYMIASLSIPLTLNGTMSISANRATQMI